MAINFDSLVVTDYVKGRADELIVKSALGAKTLDYVRIMPNVKNSDVIPFIDSAVNLQDGSACGWNPQEGDVFGERRIDVTPLKVEKEYCWKDFIATAYNHMLMVEAGREKLPFEEKFAESNVNAVKVALDTAIWQDNGTLLTNGGFIHQISALGNKETAVSGQDPVVWIDTLVEKAPIAAIAKGAYIFVSYTTFRKYIANKNASCCANQPLLDGASEAISYAGDSRITIVPVIGMEGDTQHIAVLASKDALVYGTDVEGSENVFKMWRDEKDDKFLFRILFNAGVAVARPDEVLMAIL